MRIHRSSLNLVPMELFSAELCPLDIKKQLNYGRRLLYHDQFQLKFGIKMCHTNT